MAEAAPAAGGAVLLGRHRRRSAGAATRAPGRGRTAALLAAGRPRRRAGRPVIARRVPAAGDRRTSSQRVLAELGVDAVREGDDAFLVTLPGERRHRTLVWLVLGDHHLLVESFVCRAPDENAEEVYRYLLQRNARLRTRRLRRWTAPATSTWSAGSAGRTLTAERDRHRARGRAGDRRTPTSTRSWNADLRGAIRREWAWRMSRGESVRNLRAFRHLVGRRPLAVIWRRITAVISHPFGGRGRGTHRDYPRDRTRDMTGSEVSSATAAYSVPGRHGATLWGIARERAAPSSTRVVMTAAHAVARLRRPAPRRRGHRRASAAGRRVVDRARVPAHVRRRAHAADGPGAGSGADRRRPPFVGPGPPTASGRAADLPARSGGGDPGGCRHAGAAGHPARDCPPRSADGGVFAGIALDAEQVEMAGHRRSPSASRWASPGAASRSASPWPPQQSSLRPEAVNERLAGAVPAEPGHLHPVPAHRTRRRGLDVLRPAAQAGARTTTPTRGRTTRSATSSRRRPPGSGSPSTTRWPPPSPTSCSTRSSSQQDDVTCAPGAGDAGGHRIGLRPGQHHLRRGLLQRRVR